MLFVSRIERVTVLICCSGLRIESGVRCRICELSSLAELQRLAGELSLDETVLFTDPIYEEQQLAAYFLSSNIFCYPENIGLSILHAMGTVCRS